MKKIVYFLIIMIIFLFPSKVKGYCSVENKARLKQLVSNVNISYEYEMVGNNPVFTVKLNNVGPELYFIDKNGNANYGNSNGEFVLNNYYNGQTYDFKFYGTTDCSNEEVGRLYVTLPKYNPYYNLSVCDDAKEYKLCQKWVSHSLNRKQFVEEVNKYKQEISKIDDKEVNKKISVIDLTMSFIRMYGLYIAIFIIIVIITIKFIRYKKDTFGF